MNQGLIIKNLILIAGLLFASLGTEVIFAQEIQKSEEMNSPAPTQQNDLSQFQSWLKNNSGDQSQAAGEPTALSPPPTHPGEEASAPQVNNSISQQSLGSISPKQANNDHASSPQVIIEKPLTFTQSQRAMLNSAPPSPRAPSADEIDAFDSMAEQKLPLTPKQVVRLRQLIDVSQRAAVITPNIPPKPVSSTIMVNLAPGATPPAIRLSQGYVSSLVFVDSTGTSWPIASYDTGDPKSVNIQWEPKSNVLLIQAVSPYGDSNIVVKLVGLPTPITLQLVSGQRVVDYRADIHVSGIGPNTKDLPTGTRLPDSASQLLLNVLDGVAPTGSKRLMVKGSDCQAWLLGDKMYLRTRFTVLSPGWIGRMVSPDGMNAYEIQATSAVLISQYGEPVSLKVEGF